MVESIKTLEAAVRSMIEWKVGDELRQDQTDKSTEKILEELAGIKQNLHTLTVTMTKDHATWQAHDRLKDRVEVMDTELRKFVMRTFTFGVTIAGAVFGLVQWVLTAVNGG